MKLRDVLKGGRTFLTALGEFKTALPDDLRPATDLSEGEALPALPHYLIKNGTIVPIYYDAQSNTITLRDE